MPENPVFIFYKSVFLMEEASGFNVISEQKSLVLMKSPLFMCSKNKRTGYHFKGQVWHKDIVSDKQWQGSDTVNYQAENPVMKSSS